MESSPELTRLLAAIPTRQDGYGQPGGCAEAARRLDELHKLLDEVANVLRLWAPRDTLMRRTFDACSPTDLGPH